MKFLIHGNSPTISTGYGIQIGQLAKCLRADGHEVACSSTYGIQGSIQTWDGFRVYGCGYDTQSNDRLHLHADHWFAGDPGYIILCQDVWPISNPLLKEYNTVAWTPVDHFPLQGNVAKFFELTGAIPVAMSKFGERMLFDVGLNPALVPLSVDTNVFRPVEKLGELTPRELIGVAAATTFPDDAFIVGMVAMNKGWAKDRKGFNEAFWGFKAFEETHPDAYLYVHADKWGGAEGQNLYDLAILCGLPPHKVCWSGGENQYGYYVGYTPEMMATMYSAFDVLLAPSHGEGFCVPLIEAQACGTPVIATDATAQAELIGAGWKLRGQFEHDPAHHANYICPFIAMPVDPKDIAYMALQLDGIEGAEHIKEMLLRLYRVQGLGVLDALEVAYDTRQDEETWQELRQAAVQFGGRYDTQKVYDEFWRPFIAELLAEPQKLELDREPMPDESAVAVLCPVLQRPQNVAPLVESFRATTGLDASIDEHEATLYFIVNEDDQEELDAIGDELSMPGLDIIVADGSSYAEKLNVGFENTTEPWVLVIGDDVKFHEGWLDQARKLSGEFDVIGTNDTTDKVKNPKVANGSHADHFFVRRSYVDTYGGCLDGPGILAPEVYRHWHTDVEIVRLARVRNVFSPCLDSVVEHLHPGYSGDEKARQADSTYMKAVEFSAEDERTFKDRLPLIEMQRL